MIDKELTWKDVRYLECLIDDVRREYKDNVSEDVFDKVGWSNFEDAYEEVLRRFYIQRNKKDIS